MHERRQRRMMRMTNILWLRHLFDRFHSRPSIFRESHASRTDKALHRSRQQQAADMPNMPEEKSLLRPPRPDAASTQQSSPKDDAIAGTGWRDASRNTDVPSEQDVYAQEMEHQRYGEAQPQLVPTDMIETMLHTAKGAKEQGET